MEDFKNLKVWAKAHELTVHIYERTRTFPKEEIYGLDESNAKGSWINWDEHC